MFRCERCKNTGKIREQYADFGTLGAPMTIEEGHAELMDVPIKWRVVECPDCLGFGAAGWALPG